MIGFVFAMTSILGAGLAWASTTAEIGPDSDRPIQDRAMVGPSAVPSGL